MTRRPLYRHSQLKLITAWTLSSVILLLAGCAALQEGGPYDKLLPLDIEVDDIAAVMDTSLAQPLTAQGATVAALVGDARTGVILHGHDINRLMQPASVQKMFVAADALLKLPREHRFETVVFSNGPVLQDTLYGDLILSGGWDPSLSGDEPYSEWPWAVFDSLAREVYEAGVEYIAGELIVEAAAYLPGGWEAGDLEYRFAPRISQLSWNDGLLSYAQSVAGRNSVSLNASMWPDPIFWSARHDFLWPHGHPDVVEPPQPAPKVVAEDLETPLTPAGRVEVHYVPSPRPRALAADAFRESLSRAGVDGGDSTRVITPRVMRMPMPAAGGVRIVHRSEPLDSLLAPMLKVSSNSWAEQIASGAGSYQRGEYTLGWPSVIDSLGLTPDPGLFAADACGMARRNRMRVRTAHELLAASLQRWGQRWLDVLPQGDEEGSTLEGRFEGLEGRIVAKTGSMSGTRTLAGYILDQSGVPTLDFVVFVNNSPEDPSGAIDEFVSALAGLLDAGGEEE